jgi:NADH-quinone oxidoreductase subunit E
MLSEACRREIMETLEIFRSGSHACIEALGIVVKHHGWVSDQSIRELALLLGLTAEELDATATFYNHVYRKPVGRHVILVCDSVTCWVMGYQAIHEQLTKRLGIDWGQTTGDGRFTLLPIQCLGACDRAPAMMIDEQLYCDLDPEKIEVILERYR